MYLEFQHVMNSYLNLHEIKCRFPSKKYPAHLHWWICSCLAKLSD